MKQEIMDALALELTKAKFSDPNQLKLNPTSAYDWVKVQLESQKQIEDAYNKLKPPIKFEPIPLRY